MKKSGLSWDPPPPSLLLGVLLWPEGSGDKGPPMSQEMLVQRPLLPLSSLLLALCHPGCCLQVAGPPAAPWATHGPLCSVLFVSSGLSSFLSLVCREAFLLEGSQSRGWEGSEGHFSYSLISVALLQCREGRGKGVRGWELEATASLGRWSAMAWPGFWIHLSHLPLGSAAQSASFRVFSLIAMCAGAFTSLTTGPGCEWDSPFVR